MGGNRGDPILFFFSSRRRHTRSDRDWSSDVCSSDLEETSSDKGSAYDRWEKKCIEFYRGTPEDTSSGRKDMLDVRLRCLGLKYKNIKWLKKTT